MWLPGAVRDRQVLKHVHLLQHHATIHHQPAPPGLRKHCGAATLVQRGGQHVVALQHQARQTGDTCVGFGLCAGLKRALARVCPSLTLSTRGGGGALGAGIPALL